MTIYKLYFFGLFVCFVSHSVLWTLSFWPFNLIPSLPVLSHHCYFYLESHITLFSSFFHVECFVPTHQKRKKLIYSVDFFFRLFILTTRAIDRRSHMHYIFDFGFFFLFIFSFFFDWSRLQICFALDFCCVILWLHQFQSKRKNHTMNTK